MPRISQYGRLSLPVALIVVAACSADPATEPTPPAPDRPSAVQAFPSQESLADAIPGFGGLYLDQSGRPTIFLTDVGLRGRAEQAIGPFLRTQGLGAAALQVRPGQYDYRQLDGWFNRATSEVLGLAGAVSVDLDEASNRVRIGVSDLAAVARARAALLRVGVPAGGVIIEQTEPIVQLATLRDRIRPIVAGLQINFPGFLCSIGLNATHVSTGQASFITASHCTNTQGGVENTPYWQPLQSVDPVQIATEVADPTYQKNGAGCPRGRRCRQSDAARARYAAGISFTRGQIAQTTGVNNSSITLAGTNFTITQQDDNNSVLVGQTVDKVGRTTGWSRGVVTNTCVNTGVSGTTIVQLCQTFVSAKVGGGDSGSDVFQVISGTNVRAVGILWGGNTAGTQFVYSPLKNVQAELGKLTVTQ
jgi:hypothetical protein